MVSERIAPDAFRADPAAIVREMGSLMPAVMRSEVDGKEIRRLGRLLMQTPGSTPDDALAFASVAATMLGAVLSNETAVAAMGEDARGTLMQAGGYLARTILTLETATGAEPHFNDARGPA